jgi:hypothetical protein
MADIAYQRKGISPDLTLGFGVRLWRGDGDSTRWWNARARLGVMFYREPSFLIAGISGQLNALASSSLGLELQYIDLWRGFWFQGAISPISTDGVITGGAAGYALFGLEYQRRLTGDRKGDQALLLTIHVPLGIVRVVRRQELRPVIIPGS